MEKIKPNNKIAFSLMEMMIVLLIITIIMAAAAPIITKRSKRTSSSASTSQSKGRIICEVGGCTGTDSSLITGSNGNFTFTPPTGVKNFLVTMIGGGGGSAGNGTTGNYLGGNGEVVAFKQVTIPSGTTNINIKVGGAGKTGGTSVSTDMNNYNNNPNVAGGAGGAGASGSGTTTIASRTMTSYCYGGMGSDYAGSSIIFYIQNISAGSNANSGTGGGKGGDGGSITLCPYLTNWTSGSYAACMAACPSLSGGTGGANGGGGGGGAFALIRNTNITLYLDRLINYIGGGGGGGGGNSCFGDTCARGGDGGTFSASRTSYPNANTYLNQGRFGLGGAAADGTPGYVMVEW